MACDWSTNKFIQFAACRNTIVLIVLTLTRRRTRCRIHTRKRAINLLRYLSLSRVEQCNFICIRSTGFSFSSNSAAPPPPPWHTGCPGNHVNWPAAKSTTRDPDPGQVQVQVEEEFPFPCPFSHWSFECVLLIQSWE